MTIDQAFLDELLEQEHRLSLPGFDNDAALELGLLLMNTGRERRLPITVDVTRMDQQIFHAALPGTAADNDHWVRRKVAVVRRFGHSSFYMGQSSAAKGVAFHDRFILDPLAFAAHGGAFPIIVRGTGMVGAATVSGLPQEEDHALVVEVLERFRRLHFGQSA